MIKKPLAILSTALEMDSSANILAEQLNLDFLTLASDTSAYDYLLVSTPHYLGLQKTPYKKLAPFYIDFASGKLLYRKQQAGLRKEWLSRAIGLKPSDNPIIVDATAGLGRDSFILASLGFHIILLERSPILFLLLQDALKRAAQHPSLSPIIERMHLIQANSIEWLQNSTTPIDVIYLDPMFPERKKSASVKKEMAILQELLEKDEDANQLLDQALTCATYRVVVKRPRSAANLADQTPHFALMGKNSRFDVYLIPQERPKTD